MRHGDKPCRRHPGIPRFQSWEVSILIVCNSHNFAAKQKGRPRDYGRLKEDSHFSVEKIAEFIGDVLAVSDNGSCFIDGSKL